MCVPFFQGRKYFGVTIEGILKESDFFKLLRKGANFGKLIYTYIYIRIFVKFGIKLPSQKKVIRVQS